MRVSSPGPPNGNDPRPSASTPIPDFSNEHREAIGRTTMNHHSGAPRRNSLSDNHTACAAAAEADRKVEILGNEVVNPLEKRLADLEDLNLEQRVDALFQRLRPYEDYKALVDEQVKKLRQTEQILRTKKDELEMSVKSEVQRKQAELEALTRKVQQMQEQMDRQAARIKENEEQRPLLAALTARVGDLEDPSSSTSADVNSLALDLLDRLQNGPLLHPALVRQIKLALPDRRTSDNSQYHDRNSAPPKSANSVAGDQRVGGVKKRLGRPLKHGLYARKATTDEIRKLVADSERKESDTSTRVPESLSRTPSADTSSAKRSESEASSKLMASAGKVELPKTQQKDEDVEMKEGMDAMFEASDDPPFIPGERKSMRTPKPRKFVDQVGWKEADKAMWGLNPESPAGQGC